MSKKIAKILLESTVNVRYKYTEYVTKMHTTKVSSAVYLKPNLSAFFILKWLIHQKIAELTKRDVLLKNNKYTDGNYCVEMSKK